MKGWKTQWQVLMNFPEILNEERKHLTDARHDTNHAFWLRSSKPSIDNHVFKGKSYTFPDMDYWYETPLMYFKKVWNDEFTQLITEQTSIYSSQSFGKKIHVTRETVEQFISIQMYMSILKIPAYYMYCFLETRYCPVSDLISKVADLLCSSRSGAWKTLHFPILIVHVLC